MHPTHDSARDAASARRAARFAVLSTVLAAALSPAEAATIRVGTGAGCNTNSLATAVSIAQSLDDGPHLISVVSGTYALTQTIQIHESMTIQGGITSCGNTSVTGSVTLDLDMSSAYAFDIQGSADGPRPQVEIHRIAVNGIGKSSRGLLVQGRVDVVLERFLSHRNPGGALTVVSSFSGAPSVSVNRNAPYNFLWDEHHNIGDGGAVYCRGGSIALYRTVLKHNSARDGGAIYLDDCDLEIGVGVDFGNNIADDAGGAIYSHRSTIRSSGPGQKMGAWDDAITGGFLFASASSIELTNTFISGTASSVHTPGVLYLHNSSFRLVGGPPCAQTYREFCAGIVGGTGNAIRTYGSTLEIRGAVIGSVDGPNSLLDVTTSELRMENSLIAFNTAKTLLSLRGGEETLARFDHVTIADNDLEGPVLFVDATNGAGPRLTMRSSILWETARPLLTLNAGGVTDIRCLLASATIGGSEVKIADPRFVDDYNFRLAGDSPAIDFCDFDDENGRGDFEGQLRGTDQPSIPNRSAGATVDLGYDEFLGAPATLFSDGFESGDTWTWSASTP